MHFVTETELRTNFRKAGFSQYCVTADQRLTPGAKQFLVDKKIKIVTEAELAISHEQVKMSSLVGYQEILSAELLEAALLALKQQLKVSQGLIDLEKTLPELFLHEVDSDGFELSEIEEFQVDGVEIFSEQGLLLIKLKKIYGLIHVIQAEYPQYNLGLTKASQKIMELKRQLVGESYEKTIDESM